MIKALILKFLYNLYKYPYKKVNERLRQMIRNRILSLDGGQFQSVTIRRVFKDYHMVDIGLYTHGAIFGICADPGTTIGRYCSVARGVRILTMNHPLDLISTHGFFFNPAVGICKNDLSERRPINIGNDVWIGTNAIILPNVDYISDGAVIGAGAVVNRNVPPYGIMIGNPARLVGYRFSPEIIEQLIESKWWEKSIEELMPYVEKSFQLKVNDSDVFEVLTICKK